MLDVEQNLPAVTVVLDEDVERVGVVDPAEETGIRRERNDRVLDDREVTLEGLRVLLQQRVDETEELHDPLVLSKVLVSCESRPSAIIASSPSEEAAAYP
jgi:hypothetical protein